MAKASPSKYEEAELINRGIGQTVYSSDTSRWSLKEKTYTSEGVEYPYRVLKKSFLQLLKDHQGFFSQEQAEKLAQLLIDTFLLRRSRGQKVEVPREVGVIRRRVKEVEVEAESLELFEFEDGEESKISENEKLRWVYENLRRQGVTKDDAPTLGTWGMLVHYRGNQSRMEKFYDTMVPKLLSKEDADAGGKLQDEGKETIELIERLQTALTETT